MKAYTKKRAWISLLGFIVVLALTVFTAVHGFGYDYSGSFNEIKLGLDLRGGVSITYEAVGEDYTDQDIKDTIRKMELRVQDYSTEAVVMQEGSNRITINIPGETDANEVLSELGTPGSLIFCTDTSDISGSTALTGDDISGAEVGYDDTSSSYIVVLSFTEEGQTKFAEVTGEIAGTGEPLYIIYDGQLLSYPTCETQITSPSCQIEGDFTYDSASALASYIRIGALPVELTELRSQVVGASLGTRAIQTSLIALVVGIALVILLMVAFYRMPGAAASVALLFYTALIVVILAAFNEDITLTLPGIAGIILSIGMAVDANVIIFSRIREEIHIGTSVNGAITNGFKKAFSAIIDGNVTTLIAALVLYIFGSGTVKGFAITLALGIILSMFTALVVTRLLVRSFYALGMKDRKWYGEKKKETRIDFLSKKNLFFVASAAVILIGVVAMIVNGAKKYALNYSLDFIGGTSTDVTFNETRTIEELENEVFPEISEAIGSTDITMTPVVGSSEVIIRTQVLSQEQREALYEVLEDKFDVDTSTVTYENVSGTVSAEMARSAVISVILAAIAMLIYIWIRFRDIRFAGASVLALVHDVLVVLSCYALFRWTVGNTFIACMLTLVGYSINATIVVFDRIRENLALMGDRVDLKAAVNNAVSDTLGRSINTSLTTLFMILSLYIFGVTSIKEFALPLMVGVIVGGYSSVCLAGSLWYVFRTRFAAKKTVKTSGKKK